MTHRTTSIHPRALRVGLFVRLEIGWAAHPFSFNNFLIRDAEQVRKLQALGLVRVLCDIERSEPQALKAAIAATSFPENVEPQSAPAAPPAPPPELDEMIQAKAQRLARLKAQMAQLEATEKAFNAAVREINLVTKNVFAQPAESLQRASAVVDGILASMSALEQVQLHLMNNKPNSRDVYEHELNVASLTLLLGRKLGLTDDALRDLGLACLLHDIGKRELAESLTRKMGDLTTGEREALQHHVPMSLRIGKDMALSSVVLEIIAQHHEMADGSGYPRRLKLEGMNRGAQILALINAFDNLCNPPHAMVGMTPHDALKILFARERSRFAPDALAGFIKMMGIYPPGTIVKLNDGALGLVLAVNSENALRPTVLVYEPGVSRAEPIIVDLAEDSQLNIESGLQRQELSIEAATYLNPRRRVSYYASGGAAA